jgi:hypothetical protein
MIPTARVEQFGSEPEDYIRWSKEIAGHTKHCNRAEMLVGVFEVTMLDRKS